MNEVSENTYRLRAVVRVFVSPGVWLVIASQILFFIVFSFGTAVKDAQQAPPVHPLIILVLFVAALFFLGGAYHSLAVHQNRVTVLEVFSGAMQVFGRFIGLCFKALGLFLLIFAMFYGLLVPGAGGGASKQAIQQVSLIIGALFIVLNYIFIYWLPTVFVSDNFALIPTLKTAVYIARKRFKRSGFIAALVFLPAIVSLIVPVGSALPVQVVVGFIGQLMGWIAYVYCVGIIADDRQLLKLPELEGPGG